VPERKGRQRNFQNREQFPKSVKRFSDKNCGKNKELEHSVEPSETKNALVSAGENLLRFLREEDERQQKLIL